MIKKKIKWFKVWAATLATISAVLFMIIVPNNQVHAYEWEGSTLPTTLTSGTYYLNAISYGNVTVPAGENVKIIFLSDASGNAIRGNITNYGTLDISSEHPSRQYLLFGVTTNYGNLTTGEKIYAGYAGVNSSAIVNMKSGKLTTSGTVYTASTTLPAIDNRSGEVTINGGRVSNGSGATQPSILNRWESGSTQGPTLNVNAGEVYGIKNEVLGSYSGTANINGGYITRSSGSTLASLQGTFNVKSGVYFSENSYKLTNETVYRATGKTDYPYVTERFVASYTVNGVTQNFATLKEAIDSAPSTGNTLIYVTKDVSEGTIDVSGKSIYLKANGTAKTVNANFNVVNGGSLYLDDKNLTLLGINSGKDAGVVTVNKDSTFRIDAGTITSNSSNGVVLLDNGKAMMYGGTINGTSYWQMNAYSGGVKTIGNDTSFTMIAGTIIQQSNGVYMQGGTVKISGGEIQYGTAYGGRRAVNNTSGTATITGGTFKNKNAAIDFNVSGNTKVSGGTFYSSPIANENLADGYANFGTNPYTIQQGEAKVTLEGASTSVGFTSVTDAFSSVKNGQKATITLLNDIGNRSAAVVTGANVTLDTNGKNWGGGVTNGGTLEIKNSVPDSGKLYREAGGTTVRNNADADLTITSGNFDNKVAGYATIISNGNMTINGGTIHHTNTEHAVMAFSGCKLTINGGTLYSDDGYYALSTYGDTIINGGTIGKSGNSVFAYLARSTSSTLANVVINNGTIYGVMNGFPNYYGTNLQILGGTINFDSANASTSYAPNNYGAGVTNVSGNMVINGGSITGSKSGFYAVAGDVEFQSGEINVTGAVNTNAIVIAQKAKVSMNGDVAIPAGKKIFLYDGAYLNLKKAPTKNYEFNLSNVKTGAKIVDGTLTGNIDSSPYSTSDTGDNKNFSITTASTDGADGLYAKNRDLYAGKKVSLAIESNNPNDETTTNKVIVTDGKVAFNNLLSDLGEVTNNGNKYYFEGWFDGDKEYTSASLVPTNVSSVTIAGKWVNTITHPFVVSIDGKETPYSTDMMDDMMTAINASTKPITLTLYKSVDITKPLVLNNKADITIKSTDSKVVQIQRTNFSEALIQTQGTGAVTLENISLSGNDESGVTGSLIEHNANSLLTIQKNVTLAKNRSTADGDAIAIHNGTFALDAQNVHIDGDILLDENKSIQVTSQPSLGNYFILTMAKTNNDTLVVENAKDVNAFGYFKLTNSGVTLKTDSDGLKTVASTDIKAMLKGSTTDKSFNFGYNTLAEAYKNKDLSVDAIQYITQDITLNANDTTPKDVKLIGATRVVSGEYNTIVNIENMGTSRTITTANKNALVITDNDSDQMTEYAEKALKAAAESAKTKAREAYTSGGLLGSEYDELIIAVQNQLDASIQQLKSLDTIAEIIDKQAELSAAMMTTVTDSIVTIKTDLSGNGKVSGGRAVLVNKQLTLTAVPEEGYLFDGWYANTATTVSDEGSKYAGWYAESAVSNLLEQEDQLVSKEPTFKLTATQDATYTAKFSRILLPKVTSTEEGVIHIDADETEITKVIYQYTGAESKPYTGNWNAFVKNGAYTTLRDKITDVKDIQIEDGGYYNVIITYAGGKEMTATLSVAEHPKPIVSVINGKINVLNNGSGVSKVIYQNTGDVEKPYKGNWAEFAKNGTYKSLTVADEKDVTISVTESGYYTVIVTYGQKEYWATAYIKSDVVAPKPTVSSDLDKISIKDNNSNVSKIIYQYTGEEEKPYTNWNSFVANGPITTLRPSGFVEKEIPITKAGYYTLIMTYGEKNEFEYTTTIYANTTPMPTINVDEQFIQINNNDTFVTKVIYQYTGNEEKPYTTWDNFTANGDFTISDDLEKVEAHNKGYYTIIVRYGMDGKEAYFTAKITSDNVVPEVEVKPSITGDGLKTTVSDNGSKLSKISYAYHKGASSDPTIKNWKEFSKYSYKTIIANGLADAKYDIGLDDEGWYTFLLVYNNGKEVYQSVKATEISGGVGNAMLSIDQSTITGVTLGGAKIIHIQYVLNENKVPVTNQETFYALYDKADAECGVKEGSKIVVSKLGSYSLRLLDEKGKTYYLDANITTMSPGAVIDTDALAAQLKIADDLLMGTHASDDGLYDKNGVNFERGNYVSTQDYSDLEITRYIGQTAMSATKQSEIKEATANLTKMIASFKTKVKSRQPKLVSVEGANVTFTASTDCTITKIIYTSKDQNITQGIWTNWTGFSAGGYSKLAADKTVIENIPNGVYTFLISQKEEGGDKEYYETVVIAENASSSEVVKTVVTDKLAVAKALLQDVKKESDPTLAGGESYVSDTLYKALETAINASDEDVATAVDADSILAHGKQLDKAYQSFKASIKQKQAPIEHGDLAITLGENGTATFNREDLKDVLVARGTHKSWGSFVSASYKKYDVVSGKSEIQVNSNGDYTVIARYTDGSEEYKTFTITNVAMPISITENTSKPGWVDIDVKQGVTVEKLAYTFGEYHQMDDTADYTSYDNSIRQIQVEGNGSHTIYVRVNNDGAIEDYFLNISIQDITSPFVMVNENYVAVYTRGFNVSTVAYAKGTYTTWADMASSAMYASQNTKLDIREFSEGDYTFFIKSGEEGKEDTLLQVHIGK